MNFLEYRTCIAISRDGMNRIHCVKIKSGRKNNLVVVANASVEIQDSFVNAMADVLTRIRPEEDLLLVFGGAIPGLAISEFTIPKMASSDIPSAASYELSRHLPSEISDCVTGFRTIDDGPPGKLRLRAMTLSSKDWEAQIGELRNSGVKLDAILHPFMALDPLLSEISDPCFTSIEPGFTFSRHDQDGVRRISVHEDEGERESYEAVSRDAVLSLFDLEKSTFSPDDRLADYVPALLMGAYSLSSNFENDRHTLPPLPKGMFPERFRWLRIIFFIFLALASILLLGLFGRNAYENKLRLDSLKDELSSIERKVLEIKKDEISNKKFDEMLDKIVEVEPDIGSYEVLPVLHDLNKFVSADLWMTNLNFRKDSFEATLLAKSGTKDDVDLGKSQFFSKVEKNKRLLPDQSLSINVKMQYRNPNQRLKKSED